jgi:hypothetical protein
MIFFFWIQKYCDDILVLEENRKLAMYPNDIQLVDWV